MTENVAPKPVERSVHTAKRLAIETRDGIKKILPERTIGWLKSATDRLRRNDGEGALQTLASFPGEASHPSNPPGESANGQENKQAPESETVKKMCSKEFFPPPVQDQIDSLSAEYSQTIIQLKELKARLEANRETIDPAVEEVTLLNKRITKRTRELRQQYEEQKDQDATFVPYLDPEIMDLNTQVWSLSQTLSPFSIQLGEISVPYLDQDLACNELISAEYQSFRLQNECKAILGETTRLTTPDREEKAKAKLRERIAKEQAQINNGDLFSHVSGYRGVLNILKKGSLSARKLQTEPVTSFSEKGTSEENQIVFDIGTIRASYAKNKDKEGRGQREDPVMVLMRARDLMTKHEYMDSDGRHFFGIGHDENTGHKVPFSTETGKNKMAILVPDIYRSDLIEDLTDIAKARNTTPEQFMADQGVVFIQDSDYKTPDGNIFFGNTGANQSGYAQDRAVVDHIFLIGKQCLAQEAKPIEGRVVPTAHIGEGAGGVEGKLYTFKTADQG